MVLKNCPRISFGGGRDNCEAALPGVSLLIARTASAIMHYCAYYNIEAAGKKSFV